MVFELTWAGITSLVTQRGEVFIIDDLSWDTRYSLETFADGLLRQSIRREASRPE